MVIFLAIMSSFSFGCAHVFARMGMRWSNPFGGAIISILVSSVLLWLGVTLFVPLSLLKSKWILYFVVAGLFSPALGRLLNYIGIHRVGVSRATPITATTPLFSTAIAILLVGEKVTTPVVLGTLLIILGAILLSHKKKEDLQWRKTDLIFPAIGALCFGVSSNLRKIGLLHVSDPILAATISTSAGFGFLMAFSYPNRKRNSLRIDRRSLVYFVLGGFFSGVGTLLDYSALNLGTVVVVSPLTNIFPLFAIGLSAIFLRGMETITRWIIAGAVITVLGVTLIVLR